MTQPTHSHRRDTYNVSIGTLQVGGMCPIALQTMANVSTMDTQACVRQAIAAQKNGCELFRYTAQGVREAKQLGEITAQLRQQGCMMPIVADIHFSCQPAFEALNHVDKVRINPGNFVDKRAGVVSDAPQEIEKVFGTFLKEAQAKRRAIRIGVNHGSLSPRILSRYGNTPRGMVESCMEYLHIANQLQFRDIVISMKSSNVQVMTQAVRALAHTLDEQQLYYPLHLGVTEAGADEDGRIKSAIGIGSLLIDGLGDTIRVSLSEDPVEELRFGRKLIAYIESITPPTASTAPYHYTETDYPLYHRQHTTAINGVGGTTPPAIGQWKENGTLEWQDVEGKLTHLPAHKIALWDLDNLNEDRNTAFCKAMESASVVVLKASGSTALFAWRKALDWLKQRGTRLPVFFHLESHQQDADLFLIEAAVQLGSILLQGAGNGIIIDSEDLYTQTEEQHLADRILQAVRLRMTHTEFISCPGCGRTMFDLQQTVREIKASMSHLPNLKIGIMGCIVNGPGEMADADYGYVGSGVGKIDLYKGQQPVKRNIPSAQAVAELKAIIQENGDWKDKPTS